MLFMLPKWNYARFYASIIGRSLNGLGGVFPAGVKPDSPSRGGPFLLPPFSTVRSAVLQWKVGWVKIMVFVRYISPVEHQKFLFGGYGRLVYAEAGDAVAESVVGRLSSCKRATVRTISGE